MLFLILIIFNTILQILQIILFLTLIMFNLILYLKYNYIALIINICFFIFGFWLVYN